MKGPQGWTRIGWHGIAFDVPEDWSPGRLEGDFGTGYLRIEDETHVRLEVRWESAGRRLLSATSLVDNYVKQTRRKLRTKARGAEPAIDRGRAIKELAGLDHEAFTWRGGFSAHSLLVVAPASHRVVHLRIFFEEGKEDKPLARQVFSSLRVAPQDGLNEWAAFGFRFLLNEAWRLDQSSMRTGCLQFVFKEAGDELEVVRQSLAEITLRGTTLGGWFLGFFGKALRGFSTSLSKAERGGHPAVRCEGYLRRSTRPLAIFRRRRFASALAWHCTEADKIFAVRANTTTANDPLVGRCADSIACH